jgi:hypothetical protein
MTTITSITPILLSATPTVTADGMRIDLVFNTAMAAGSGTIFITDGAVQTVIDRATGQPAMRVVGATDTHTISAASVSVDGAHVKLNVAGLLPDHAYSIVMGNGVLVSTAHVAFGGVRATSQLQFTTDPAPDGDAPALVSHELDSSLLKAGGSLQVTLVFSEPVTGLTADALGAPNASVSALVPVGDGHTWLATLVPSGPAEQPANVLTIDMSKVRDAAGNAGKGISNVASYSVDTKGPAATIALDSAELTSGHDIVATVSFSEAVKGLDAAALQAEHASITNISSEDGKTWKVTLHASDAATASGSVLNLDLGKVADLAGNAGSGVVKSDSYAVDTQAPAGVSIALDGALLKDRRQRQAHLHLLGSDQGASGQRDRHAACGHQRAGEHRRRPHLDRHPHRARPEHLERQHDRRRHEQAAGPEGQCRQRQLRLQRQLCDRHRRTGGCRHPAERRPGLRQRWRRSRHQVFRKGEPGRGRAPGAERQPARPGHTTDGGLTWKAFLRPGSPIEASGNTLSIDMGKVHDLAGNAGSGSVNAAQTYDVDTRGPGATISLDGGELLNGGAIAMTIVLSQKVENIAGILDVPGATLLDTLHTDDGGLTWKATLATSLNLVDAVNAVTLDLRGVHDAHGNAGSLVTSDNYVIDGTVTSYVEHAIDILDWSAPYDDHVSNSNNQVLSGTLSGPLLAGQHLVVSIDGAAEVEVQVAPEDSFWTYGDDGMFFADGVHTIAARVVDDAHHASAAFTQQFTIDTVKPTLLSSPDGASGNASDDLVFTFSEAMHAQVGEGRTIIEITGPDYDPESYSDVGRTRIEILPENLSADGKTLTIHADPSTMQSGNDYEIWLPEDLTDLAGNSLPNLDPLHFRTSGSDTLAPRALSAAAVTSAGIYGIGQEIEIAVAFSEAVRMAGSGTPTLHLTNDGVATWDHISADGHTMYFRYIVGANGEDDTHGSESLGLVDNADLAGHVSDLAGNLLDQAHINFSALDIPWADGYGDHDSGGTIQIDAHAGPAPGAPVLAAASDTGATGDNMTQLHTPGFTGSGTASFATVMLFDENGDPAGQDHEQCRRQLDDVDGDWADGKSLADGAHQLTVKQYDGANNASPASAALTLTVDSVIAPATVALHADSDSGSSHSDLLTNQTQPGFTGTGDVGALVRVFDGSTVVGEVRVDNSGIYEVRSLYSLAEGEHTLTVEQTDLAGNTSDRSTSAPLSFRIDFSAPDAPGKPVLDAPATAAARTATASPTQDPDHQGHRIRSRRHHPGVRGRRPCSAPPPSRPTRAGRSRSAARTAIRRAADGAHSLAVRQVDAAGNRSAVSQH